MSDKPLPLLIGSTAAAVFMVGFAVTMVVVALLVLRIFLCH
jgi:hypothetical protein